MSTSDEVRALALSLPGTTEKEAWSMPTFRVAGKMFLTLPENETSMAVRCPKLERDELVLAEPGKFWIADHEAAFAWVRVRLAALDDADELRAIVVDSWRQAAPPKLLGAHPELAAPADGPQ
ncbi:MmcQ/YjbR family DNA-binding protein [Streptomyces sp. NPDC048604]|uniref:MmcQ/YjbR family DNA-binding protein n=1 Tax=Streptomyces sp. NPDC048604 TaxID=3365578 RepID=UPI003714C563